MHYNIISGRGLQCRDPGMEGSTSLCIYFFVQAYFVTNDAPLPFWEFISHVLTGLGYKSPTCHLPYGLVYYIAMFVQLLCTLVSPLVTINSTFTPVRVALAGTHHYFSCERAKRDFGFKPVVDFDVAVTRTLEYFSFLKK